MDFMRLNPDKPTQIKAFEFLCAIYESLEKRNQNSLQQIKRVAFANQKHVLSNNIPDFKLFPDNAFKTFEAENEYRLIKQIDWHTQTEKSLKTMTTTEFWTMVFNHERFNNLGRYMLSLCILPISNAATERIFSICGAIKTKARNKLIISTVDSIVRIKTEFMFTKKCCNEFEITPRMIELLSNNIYRQK